MNVFPSKTYLWLMWFKWSFWFLFRIEKFCGLAILLIFSINHIHALINCMQYCFSLSILSVTLLNLYYTFNYSLIFAFHFVTHSFVFYIHYFADLTNYFSDLHYSIIWFSFYNLHTIFGAWLLTPYEHQKVHWFCFQILNEEQLIHWKLALFFDNLHKALIFHWLSWYSLIWGV